jgi:hypothetical protein
VKVDGISLAGENVLFTITTDALVEYKYSSYFGFAKKVSVPSSPSSILDKPLTLVELSPTISPDNMPAICSTENSISQKYKFYLHIAQQQQLFINI